MDPKVWVSGKIENNEFRYDEFLEILFPHQEAMREQASTIIKHIQEEGPNSLNSIIKENNLTRGTAYDAVKYLKRWGILERSGKYSPLRLSGSFSTTLRKIADYWEEQK